MASQMTAAILHSKEEEIAQLQQLVNNLKHQNDILRNERSASDCSSFPSTFNGNFVHSGSKNFESEHTPSILNSEKIPTTDFDKMHPSADTRQESESISNIDVSKTFEEEFWLYVPAKYRASSFPTNTSCMQWAREVFDSPESHFFANRNALLYKLSAILSKSSNEPTSVTIASPYITLNSVSIDPIISPSKSLNIASKLAKVTSFNTATFTRPRKIQSNSSERLVPINAIENQGTSSDSCDDFHLIARIQENDLKAQVAAMTAASMNKAGSEQSLSALYDPAVSLASPRLTINKRNLSYGLMPTCKSGIQVEKNDNSEANGFALLRIENEELNEVGCGEASILIGDQEYIWDVSPLSKSTQRDLFKSDILLEPPDMTYSDIPGSLFQDIEGENASTCELPKLFHDKAPISLVPPTNSVDLQSSQSPVEDMSRIWKNENYSRRHDSSYKVVNPPHEQLSQSSSRKLGSIPAPPPRCGSSISTSIVKGNRII